MFDVETLRSTATTGPRRSWSRDAIGVTAIFEEASMYQRALDAS
ncbi:MAG: hypothetical protein ACYDEY_08885 [Acidimicrobiales bacterium]